jgi:hypothetical protein
MTMLGKFQPNNPNTLLRIQNNLTYSIDSFSVYIYAHVIQSAEQQPADMSITKV